MNFLYPPFNFLIFLKIGKISWLKIQAITSFLDHELTILHLPTKKTMLKIWEKLCKQIQPNMAFLTWAN
jgi:hypothetical protein